MNKVLKEDVFREIVILIEKGDYKLAQKMLSIISDSIQKEKANGVYSDSLLLNNRKEELVFQELINKQGKKPISQN